MTFTVNQDDLAFILKQIQIAERVSAGESLTSVIGQDAALLPFGLRAVDGSDNNLNPGSTLNGAAGNTFPRLLDPSYINNTGSGPFGPVTNTNYQAPGDVVDTAPRTISNLITNQTVDNPAAVEAWLANPLSVEAWQAANPGKTPVAPSSSLAGDGIHVALTNADLAYIPNQSPDIGLSPGFNSWMTFFGQFFDHGLDLVTKGGNGTVYIPLKADDPLITVGPDGIAGTGDEVTNPQLQFMALTRATPFVVNGVVQAENTTTAFVDQNQTYTSHASHQVFLREYARVDTGEGLRTVATGRLLDGTVQGGSQNGAIGNWGDVKAQALAMLGIELTDFDVHNVPLLRTDPYGRFIPDPATGYAQVITGAGPDGVLNTADDIVASGTPAAPVRLEEVGALRTGHAFLNDIAHHATPGFRDFNHDGIMNGNDVRQVADSDPGVGDDNNPLTYDDEMLDAHFITGDGRGNENIALTAVHSVFHSEHNRLVEANKATILATGDKAFINEWLLVDLGADDAIPANPAAVVWDGERLFQAAKFVTEMQYQHLVFEEFARSVQPNVDPFVFTNSAEIDASILAEFAHVVYRFGHSMLTDTVDRLENDLTTVNGDANQETLIAAFLNPQMYLASGGDLATTNANIIRGLTRDVGNEIDEFVVPALQTNLLGLPLDLPALNIARGREQGIPSLNDTRAQLYHDFSDPNLKPYVSWADFAQNIKNPLSIINFIAAYGTHATVVGAATLEAKRGAASLLVLGGSGAPADRLDFLNARGIYAPDGSGPNDDSRGGLNHVDLWIGGLAEEKKEFGGMLGSTFNFVFEYQLEHLQNGDRMYYLSRTQGLNLLNQLEPNTFTDMVMRNTALGDQYATHLNGSLFKTPDVILELDRGIAQEGADPEWDDPAQQGIDPKVVRDYTGASTIDVGGVQHDVGGTLKFSGGEHVVLGGTEGNDTLIGDKGIDTLWGDGGDDRLDAGMESDQVFGGTGDDIIEDPFGDDMLRGEDGNDVISGGTGIDLLFGGSGQDFIMGSTDTKEVFAGEGNDFILGGSAPDGLMGNEGDDWIEGGEGFDGLSGENSQLFFNSTIVGHDVLNGQSNDTDYDGENGDDIMVQGAGIQRNNGMDGFDWAIHKGATNPADSDLGIRPFDTRQALILRDRFDSVEGLSGWKFNDVLTGAAKLLAGEAFADSLTQASVDRIDGLRAMLGVAAGPADQVVMDTDTGAEIIIGGAGNDVIRGNLGDDFIDGDAWLNVRIAVHANKDGTGPVIRSVDSLNEIKAEMLAGTINPGQLQIVREIVYAGVTPAEVDTAVFSGNFADYTISAPDANGVRVVTDTVGTDGSDHVRNVERMQFADQTLVVSSTNAVATGIVTVSDTTPTEKQVLTATVVSLSDPNLIRAGTIAIHWQVSDGTGWQDILGATGASFTPGDAEAGLELRAVATFLDGLGVPEAVASAATAAVIPVNDAPTDILSDPLLVDENVVNGTVVGTVTGVDPDSTGLTYSLTNNAGGRFAINAAGQITVADRVLLDFEQSASHVVQVSVSDGSLSFAKNVTIAVQDIAPENLVGDARANILRSGAGSDTLNGLSGTDDMAGGADSDTYLVDNAGDAVTELAGGGALDVVFASASWTMTAGSEIEELRSNYGAGATGLTLTGNGLANTIIGGGAADQLLGGAGADTLTGAAGSDTLTGDAGADRLEGGLGQDSMLGGAGSDTYLVDNTGDIVVELAGGGALDVVFASANWTMAAGAEIEELRSNYGAGGTGLTLTGNGLANTIIGGGAADQLLGGAGADTLTGAAGSDTLTGGAGADRLEGGTGVDSMLGGADSDTYLVDNIGDIVVELAGGGALDVVFASASWTMAAGAEIEELRSNYGAGATGLTLTGNGLANTIIGGGAADGLSGGNGNDTLIGGGGIDTLTGGAGADRLEGGTGQDSMLGGADSDTYLVDNTGDIVVELAGGGALDVVFTSANWTMAAGLEIEELRSNYGVGGTGLTLTGNDLVNLVVGGSAADQLFGGGGNDTLSAGGGSDTIAGGSGNDTMTGAGGSDTFVFAAGFGTDRITDFDANPAGGQDLIDLTSYAAITAGSFAAQVAIAQVGAAVRISIGADTITLAATNVATITASDFIFHV